jgi:hypothetical protein
LGGGSPGCSVIKSDVKTIDQCNDLAAELFIAFDKSRIEANGLLARRRQFHNGRY